jgi:hypothetical protein
MVLALAALAILGTAPDSGEALLRRMNAEHRDTWFTSLVFVQHTTYPGTARAPETWYETMVRPGRLRIDIERGGAMVSTMIFRDDTLHQLAGGTLRGSQPLVHSLLLLLHDIHVGDADAVIGKLRGQGFDLSRTHATSWEGRPIIVVGAAPGDTTTAQFWVDPARLVVVRVLQSGPGGAHNDTRIGKFSAHGPALLEREITFVTNGAPRMVEEYTWVRVGDVIPAAVFDPTQPGMPAWVAEYRAARGTPRDGS